MSKANQQEHVSLLSSAKNGLIYLTANDWALIVDKASIRQFKKGERLVERDKLPQGVFLLVKGTASVEIAGQGKARSLGPGEICGEISFLDELPTTADVVASGTVDAYFLDRATLQSMFELFPHLGSRFYRSLATILSRRMRGMIGSQVSAKEAAAGPLSSKTAPAK
jgi:extracellular factor (EF) 3-hydroxypalmitic acid methyl ester biosynthesis protein